MNPSRLSPPRIIGQLESVQTELLRRKYLVGIFIVCPGNHTCLFSRALNGGSSQRLASRHEFAATYGFPLHNPLCPLLSCFLRTGGILFDLLKPISATFDRAGREVDRHERRRHHEQNAARSVPHVRRSIPGLKGR